MLDVNNGFKKPFANKKRPIKRKDIICSRKNKIFFLFTNFFFHLLNQRFLRMD